MKYADKDKLDICVRHEAVILVTEHEVCATSLWIVHLCVAMFCP